MAWPLWAMCYCARLPHREKGLSIYVDFLLHSHHGPSSCPCRNSETKCILRRQRWLRSSWEGASLYLCKPMQLFKTMQRGRSGQNSECMQPWMVPACRGRERFLWLFMCRHWLWSDHEGGKRVQQNIINDSLTVVVLSWLRVKTVLLLSGKLINSSSDMFYLFLIRHHQPTEKADIVRKHLPY